MKSRFGNLDVVTTTFKLNLINGPSPLAPLRGNNSRRWSRRGRRCSLAAEISPTALGCELRAVRGGNGWPRQESQGRLRSESLNTGKTWILRMEVECWWGTGWDKGPGTVATGEPGGSKHLERRVVPLSWCWRAVEAPRRPDTNGLGGR